MKYRRRGIFNTSHDDIQMTSFRKPSCALESWRGERSQVTPIQLTPTTTTPRLHADHHTPDEMPVIIADSDWSGWQAGFAGGYLVDNPGPDREVCTRT